MPQDQLNTQDPAFDRKPWFAFMRYGAAITVAVCTFLYYREEYKRNECSEIVAWMWDWNIARTLGAISRCPYLPEYDRNRLMLAAFFILWPTFVFLLSSLILMRLDRAGVFNIVGRVKSLFR